ncbi:hypothetical protein [Ekhidna sp.]|uniref:hypothetical protein n=1 Tax=Ekhidna sp. TaxID=2608089 RepID=UPI0032996832
MKNLLRAIFLLSIISCQPTATDETSEGSDYEIGDTEPSMYAVSLAEAQRNIKFYDSLSKVALGVDPIRAFTIRSIDFAEAIGLPEKNLKKAEYTHLRIYLGLDSATREFKIYLTPVDSAKMSKGIPGKDVILNGPYKGNGKGLSDEDGPYVLDFSQPCPNACDDGSPLNE